METAKCQSKDSLKRPPPIGFSIESPFTFGRLSVGIALASCWLRVNPSPAPHRPPVNFALDSRCLHVNFASDSCRNRRKHAAKDRSAAPLERAASGADAPLRWQRKNRAPTLPSTKTVCSRPHPHADALAATRGRFTASARGCPAPPATASRYWCRQRSPQASARTC